MKIRMKVRIDKIEKEDNKLRLYVKIPMFNNYKKDCLSKENSLITDLFIGYFSFEYS